MLALGLATGLLTPVYSAVALLAATLLLRHQDRLLVAPLYGAGLLVVEELATRSSELAGVDRVGPGVIGARLAGMLVMSALGACAAAACAAAVTIALGRSLALTAAGVAVALLTFGLVTLLVRRQYSDDQA